MMTIDNLRAHVQRFHELCHGLARETLPPNPLDNDPIYLERRAYQKALRDAIDGLEGARVALATAIQRLEGDGTTRARGYRAPMAVGLGSPGGKEQKA
jgi:hypothetical protein